MSSNGFPRNEEFYLPDLDEVQEDVLPEWAYESNERVSVRSQTRNILFTLDSIKDYSVASQIHGFYMDRDFIWRKEGA